MEEYPIMAPDQASSAAMRTSDTLHEPGTMVSGPAKDNELATRTDNLREHVEETGEVVRQEAEQFSQTAKEQTSKAGHFLADQVSGVRHRTREFFSVPGRKLAAIGGVALALIGVMRIRHHEQEKPQSNMEKLKARFS